MAATTTRLVCCFHRSLLACNRSTRKPVLTVRKICPVKSGCSFYISYCGPRGLSTWHDRERNEGSQFINDGKSETHIPRSIQSSKNALGKEYNLEKLLGDVEEHKKGLRIINEESYSTDDEREKSVRTEPMAIGELVKLLNEENAQDVCVINVPKELCYVNYFVVCTGSSQRHLLRMAEELTYEVKHAKMSQGVKASVEGRDSDEWMAVDLGNVVVHFMTSEAREKYELEKLWSLGPRYDDQFRSALKLLALRGDLPK